MSAKYEWLACPLCAGSVKATCPHLGAEREAVWAFYEVGSIEYMRDSGPLPPQWHEHLMELLARRRELPDASAIIRHYYDQKRSAPWGRPCAKCGEPVYPPTNLHMKEVRSLGGLTWHGECFPEGGTSARF